jgi:hypothetical protein
MSATDLLQNAPGPPRVQVAGPSDWVVSAANPASIRARTPPPAPDPDEPPLTGAMAPPSIPDPAPSAPSLGYHDTNVGQQRVVFTWGRGGDILVGVERAPDWDLDGPPLRVDEAQMGAVLAVVERLGIRIKDWTGIYAETSVGRPHSARAAGDDASRRTRGRPPGSGKRQRATQAGESVSGTGREWLATAGSPDRPDGGDHLIESMDRLEAESG